ncbi:MAG TPA: VWA domain-containing protein [Pyrinomonadaceae bacterium]|jgi:VWFA-related protein|nr:VWA domain-containing protein [Pyrinomonadaceae bacterium]
MKRFATFLSHSLFLLSLVACGAHAAHAQQTPKPDQPDDVVRVTTAIVQTDVMVFDKQGRFVDNLLREQFELKIDGQVQPISFFERVTAGSVNEDAKLAAARSGGDARVTPVKETAGTATAETASRGRTVMFFVDDFHLAPDSLARTRKTILRFIDTQMNPNDQASIHSTSDQMGFLQQLTSDKEVLRAAVAKLNNRSRGVMDMGRPPMNEFHALAINRGERDVLDFFVEQLLKQSPEYQRAGAEEEVKTRAQQIAQQAIPITTNTLIVLENFVRTAARIPGRKLAYFFSDGFFLDVQQSDANDRLRRITDAAGRAGVVIYSLDARGLSTGLPDASVDVAADASGRMSRVSIGALAASQDALNALAADTGGRAFLNNNDLDAGIAQGLKETSVYYLLAWRPGAEAQAAGKFRRIEVSIVGRPDLKVRMRRGFIEGAATTIPAVAARTGANPLAASAAVAEAELGKALSAPAPLSALPTSVVVTHVDLPNSGPLLTVSLQVSSDALTFEDSEGKRTAWFDLAGVVLDKEGKQASSFKKRVSVNPTSPLMDARHKLIFYNHQTQIAPGMYQVRVGTRDAKSGLIGTATQWVEIPDIKAASLSLSSLMLVEQLTDGATADAGEAQGVQKGVTRRFSRNGRLRFLLYIYNAARTDDEPDLALQIQVLRDNQPAITVPLREVTTEEGDDLARIPYAAEVPLEGLTAGEYTLQVNVLDRTSKTSATQRATFVIE